VVEEKPQFAYQGVAGGWSRDRQEMDSCATKTFYPKRGGGERKNKRKRSKSVEM